jgi:hypothetical protein
MTSSQPTRRPAAAMWRAARRIAAGLRAIYDDQGVMWGAVLAVSSRAPVDRVGPLAWTPSPDGPG